ncbi:hypothetical protein G6F57_017639 [Rhizopus arrhizus]|nr:hypothetical protein G6F57_017639 [Rhizopus arrhizus]
MLGVVEAACAGIVDRQSDQVAAFKAAQHRVCHAAIERGALVRDRPEDIGQAKRLGQGKCIVQCTGIHAGDVDGTEACHVQPAGGLTLQRFADPLHRSDGRVVGHVHVGGGQQGAAVHAAARPAAAGGEHRRSQAGQRSTRWHGPAGNVTEAGKAHQRRLSCLDVVDAGGIAGCDQIALAQRPAAQRRTGQCEGVGRTQATGEAGRTTGTDHLAVDEGFRAQVDLIAGRPAGNLLPQHQPVVVAEVGYHDARAQFLVTQHLVQDAHKGLGARAP